MHTPIANRSFVSHPLFERYRLDHEAGRTDAGVVFDATEFASGKRVEIEIDTAIADDGERARVTRDAMMAQRLDGEHVLSVYDVGALSDGSPFIVREPALTTLAAEVERRAAIPVAQAVGWTLEICEALAEAHALGMSHGDVRPETVVLARGRSGTPVAKLRWTTRAKASKAAREDVARDIAGAGMLLRFLASGNVSAEADGATTLPTDLSYAIARSTTLDDDGRFRNVGEFVASIEDLAPAGHPSARNVRFLLSRAGIVGLSPPKTARQPDGAASSRMARGVASAPASNNGALPIRERRANDDGVISSSLIRASRSTDDGLVSSAMPTNQWFEEPIVADPAPGFDLAVARDERRRRSRAFAVVAVGLVAAAVVATVSVARYGLHPYADQVPVLGADPELTAVDTTTTAADLVDTTRITPPNALADEFPAAVPEPGYRHEPDDDDALGASGISPWALPGATTPATSPATTTPDPDERRDRPAATSVSPLEPNAPETAREALPSPAHTTAPAETQEPRSR